MKLKTKAIENYMALGGSLPLSHVSFIFLHGVPVPGVCPLKTLPLSLVLESGRALFSNSQVRLDYLSSS